MLELLPYKWAEISPHLLNKRQRKKRHFLKHHGYLKEKWDWIEEQLPFKNYDKGEKIILFIVIYSTIYLYLNIVYIRKKH